MKLNATITNDHPKSCLKVVKNNRQVMKPQEVNFLWEYKGYMKNFPSRPLCNIQLNVLWRLHIISLQERLFKG